MSTITRNDIESLIESGGSPCVSVFMPTNKSGPNHQEDPTRLRNLLKQAERELTSAGMRAVDAETILRPGYDLVADGLFWEHQDDGLALYLSDGGSRYFQVPTALTEAVFAADRCHVKPLLPLLRRGGEFSVLAVSQGRARFLHGNADGGAEVVVEGMPESADEVLDTYDLEKLNTSFHGARPGTGRTPGMAAGGTSYHGAGEPDPRDYVMRYLKKLDAALHPVLRGRHEPLVLACVEALAPMYREANSYRGLVEEFVPGNPDGSSDAELLGRARPIAEKLRSEEFSRALASFGDASGSGRALSDPAGVVEAAMQGRIDTLFADIEGVAWGIYDRGSGRAEVHSERGEGDLDLVELAAVETLRSSGRLFPAAAEHMPAPSPIAATLRY